MPADDGSFSIPQVAACVIIGYFVLRWFLKSPDAAAATSSSGGSSTAAAASRRPVDRRRLAQQVEVVKGMFPQFSEAAIEAELLRNGLSIEVTTDRILSTGFLPEPPRPAAPSPTPAAAASSSSRAPTPAARQRMQNQTGQAASSAASGPKVSSQYPDLITRYNLHHRLNEERSGESTPTGLSGKGKAPATKADRQMVHKTKRDEMVLEARRTVERMIKEGKHPV